MKKKIIAIVDTESEFRAKFEKVLQEFNLIKEYTVQLFELTGKRAIPKCIDTLRRCKERLAVIMIDLVIFELVPESEYLRGIEEVVKVVREEFPNLPLLLITKHIDNKHLPLMGWGSLEDIDGVFVKQYFIAKETGEREFNSLVPFDKSDIERIIEKAKNKRNKYVASTSFFVPENIEKENYEKIKKLWHPDQRSALQIEEIRATTFRHLLEELFSEQVSSSAETVISYLRPGFSGSYLFKVDMYLQKKEESWLMKVNNTKEIEKEFDNYEKVTKNLPKENYPSSSKQYVTYGNCGAFGIELKNDMITLSDYINSPKTGENFAIIPSLGRVLRKLYRNVDNEIPTRLWKEYYQFSRRTYLRLLAFFEDRESLLQQYCAGEEIGEIKQFVDTQGGSLRKQIYEKTYNIRIGNIHGDLNAQNVLVDPNSEQILIIDYANVDPQGHLTRDIAKLEADIIFSVLDNNNTKFYDWNKISEWDVLLNLLDSEHIFNFDFKVPNTDREIKKIGNFIVSLRKTLREDIYPGSNEGEYLSSLLYYSFHYLTYPDISIQKKVFGMKWLSKIINLLKDTYATV